MFFNCMQPFKRIKPFKRSNDWGKSGKAQLTEVRAFKAAESKTEVGKEEEITEQVKIC